MNLIDEMQSVYDTEHHSVHYHSGDECEGVLFEDAMTVATEGQAEIVRLRDELVQYQATEINDPKLWPVFVENQKLQAEIKLMRELLEFARLKMFPKAECEIEWIEFLTKYDALHGESSQQPHR